MSSFFPNGIQGLADSLWSGVAGSAYRLVGIDFRTTPGLIQVHQKLTKHSGTTIDELCKQRIAASDGSNLWFSAESGKIWREVGGVYTLVYTTAATTPKIIDYNESTLSGSQSFGASVTRVGQSFTGNGGTLASAKFSLRLNSGSAVGNMTAYVYAHSGTFGSGGVPTGAVLATSGTVAASTLTGDYAQITFTFTGGNKITLDDGTNYFVVVEYVQSTTEVVQIEPGNSHPGNGVLYNPGGPTWTAQSTDFNFSVGVDPESICLGAAEYDNFIYWATETAVHRKPVRTGSYDVLDTWTDVTLDFGAFANSDNEFHPMCVQNLELFIGDKIDIAKVDINGTFASTTTFNIKAPERIQTLIDFDIDILVGTRNGFKARVLRWDTTSDSWGAEDTVEEEGINAFIRDDNFVYVSAGDYGRLYFYDGEKLVPYKRIPGTWNPNTRGTIHPNAVGFHLGVPLFGLSSIDEDPALQGVYGFGSYSKDYPKVLSLDYPISTGGMSNIDIGAILVRGADVYVAFKDGLEVGVDKLDWGAKYASAYIQTIAIISPQERSKLKTATRVYADYVSLPTDTDIDFEYKKAYETNFTAMTSSNNSILMQKEAKESLSSVVNLQFKISFTVSGNECPQVENIGCDITMQN